MVMAVVLAIYGFVDLVLLLAAAQVERAKTLVHALRLGGNWRNASLREKATERMGQLRESDMRLTKSMRRGR